MKIQFVFLLLVLLYATVLSVDPVTVDRYKNFINQHIYGEMTVGKCSDVIRRRQITKTDTSQCKDTNTFIRANTNLVRNICDKAGEPYREKPHLRISLKPFNIIVCNLRNQARQPSCEYRGQDRTRKIVIECKEGFPVHFEEDVMLTG